MWEKRFLNICKDLLNNPVLSLEPNSIKFPKSGIGFLLWLSFLPLCGGLNNFHDDTLTRAGNLFLRVRNILFQVQNYIEHLVKKYPANQEDLLCEEREGLFSWN